LIADGLVTA